MSGYCGRGWGGGENGRESGELGAEDSYQPLPHGLRWSRSPMGGEVGNEGGGVGGLVGLVTDKDQLLAGAVRRRRLRAQHGVEVPVQENS